MQCASKLHRSITYPQEQSPIRIWIGVEETIFLETKKCLLSNKPVCWFLKLGTIQNPMCQSAISLSVSNFGVLKPFPKLFSEKSMLQSVS